MKTLVIATHNNGKAREISALLGDLAERYETAGMLGLPEPEETGKTFEANALLKARAAVDRSGKPALADDSGLSVTALGGDPGIYSARWAGEPRDFGRAMKRVHDELSSHDDKSASFVCALALVWPEGKEIVVTGTVAGQIVWPPRGDKGFGYDPVFQPDGYNITFGEMAPDEKHRISHRANAFELLLGRLQDE